MSSNKVYLFALLAVVLCSGTAHAGQGCPFEDGSCQEYCNQQGCNLGYCGHFAWIQCICRKCGDEWNWYDKVHYNPNQQVNQTELDSLKLNGSVPIILTNTQDRKSAAAAVEPSSKVGREQKRVSVLTTLLIPDLSDSSRLDLNDIPDENSEKFLDYLAKNHEKLVQATSSERKQSSSSTSSAVDVIGGGGGGGGDEEDQTSDDNTTTTVPDNAEAQQGDEMVEIEISSQSNGNNQQQRVAPASTTTTSSVTNEQAGPVTRLLRMAVAERLSDELN